MRAVSNHNYDIIFRNFIDNNFEHPAMTVGDFITAARIFEMACEVFSSTEYSVELLDGETGEILADNQ